MPRYPRFFQFASVAMLLSLSDGRSAQTPPELVTRFRAVEGYSAFITFNSDDDMKVESGVDSVRWTHKEQFVARIDLTERHLDNDYVEWRGEEFAEQILEQTRRETHFSGGSVYETKSVGQGRSNTKVHLYIDELKRTFHVSVDTEYIPATESGFSKQTLKETEQISGETSLVTTAVGWVAQVDYLLPDAGLGLLIDKPYPKELCGAYLQDFESAQHHFGHGHLGQMKLDFVPLGQPPKPPAPQPDQDIHADPGGPYSLQRGNTVTLDGSRSVPSKGHRLQSYEWELTPKGTPDGCSGIGTKATMSGARVTFLALCSLDAKLTVKDDGGKEDSGGTVVAVKVRPWKTKFTTEDKVKNEQSFPFTVGGFVFGYTRCARTGHFSESDNHWYEAPSVPM